MTHAVKIEGSKGYITANPAEDGTLHEVFVHGFGKMGSTMQGWTDSFCIMLSLGLQSGLTIDKFVPRLAQMKFPPNGHTDNVDIPFCFSVPDYICRWIVRHYGSRELEHKMAQIHSNMKTG